MHIKSVILDGFKSYADRTDIGVFDPHFNAITGLNGSGKSNILDGIIFVLGLSSLHTVRAQSLADLIHKGSTQVKKATVSIIFDNKDKSKEKCPAGYEHYPEIVVSRTIEPGLMCKYYLNGHTSTKKVIQEMFESVKLNINNPNFMIMQGKITKVVNMKPKELLHMIEETVGALSYQTKRDKSCKEIEEKDRQLAGTNRMMDEVVRPAIERQLKAARHIDEYKYLRIKLDKRSEEYAYLSYAHHLKELEKHTLKLNTLESVDRNDDAKVVELKDLIKSKKKEQEKLKQESNARVKEKLEKLEKTKGAERKKLAGIEAQFEAASDSVTDAIANVKSAEKVHKDEVKQMDDFKKKSAALIAEFTAIKAEINTAEESLKSAKAQESELNSGKVLGDDGKAINLREHLINIEDELGKIRPNHDHESKLLANEQNSLKQKQAELAKTPSDAQIEREFRTAEADVNKLKKTLTQKQLNPEEFPMIEKRSDELKGRLHRVGQDIRACSRNHPYLLFQYSDPYPNFNKKSVHGCFFELFEVKDLATHGKAIDVALGGFVSQVIVDTPEISKALINHGDLARRTTFMPISAVKERARGITQDQLDKKLGRNKAIPALDCLAFDPKYSKIVQHYVGGVVICNDEATAKVVAYQMGCKGITLEGDVIDSEGLMQGGTRKNVGETIKVCHNLRALVLEEREIQIELQQLDAKLTHYNSEAGILNEFESALRKLRNADDLRKCTAYAALNQEIGILKETVANRSGQIKLWADEMAGWQKKQKELTDKLDHFEENKAKSMKATQALIQKWTKAFESANVKYNNKQATFKEIGLELDAKEALIANCLQDIEEAKKYVTDLEEECKKKKALLDEVNTVFQAKDADYEDAVKEAQLLDDQVANLTNEVDSMQQKIQNIELGKMARDNSRKELKESTKALKTITDGLVDKYTNLDFKNPDAFPKARKKLSELKSELDKEEKNIEERRLRLDYTSAGKADESQSQLTSALERMAQVTKNRVHIQEAIDTLDLQKMHLVGHAFDHINEDFGKMMSTLLPESQAKLVPVRPGELELGVNIHVCLGGVWKESLSELSGGQRSLVALALVLALCLYKPAPFYVLDEVDAALDLSHTQNIGVIIQQRFKDTQFVCVSLKDGMYTNANVLFQTSFTNGKSTVTRSFSTKA